MMTYSEQIEQVRQALHEADAVVIGAGSGLSTSAGLTYSGPRFQEHFGDFIQKYKTPGDFTLLILWKNIGHGGAAIF